MPTRCAPWPGNVKRMLTPSCACPAASRPRPSACQGSSQSSGPSAVLRSTGPPVRSHSFSAKAPHGVSTCTSTRDSASLVQRPQRAQGLGVAFVRRVHQQIEIAVVAQHVESAGQREADAARDAPGQRRFVERATRAGPAPEGRAARTRESAGGLETWRAMSCGATLRMTRSPATCAAQRSLRAAPRKPIGT